MGNILPEHLFNDNTIIKTLNDPSSLYRISSKLMSTTPAFWTPTTMTKTVVDKTVNPTEIAKNADPLHRQTTKCDENEGSIAVLGTIVGVSLIANVIFSILLFRR